MWAAVGCTNNGHGPPNNMEDDVPDQESDHLQELQSRMRTRGHGASNAACVRQERASPYHRNSRELTRRIHGEGLSATNRCSPRGMGVSSRCIQQGILTHGLRGHCNCRQGGSQAPSPVSHHVLILSGKAGQGERWRQETVTTPTRSTNHGQTIAGGDK